MMLLRLITWPYVRQHLLRCLLTTAGIVLGVAVFVGMHTANQSVLFAFNRTVDRIAGATQLQISAGEPGFPEAVLEQVQNHPDVETASPVIEAVVQTGIPGQGNLLVLGVDMTGDRSLRDYDLDEAPDAIIDDPLVFLAQPDSLIVSRQFSDATGLKLNDRVPMETMAGRKQFTIRGVMKSGGLASAFGGSLAIMDIYAAQMVFGRGRTYDRVDLRVRPGVSVDEARGRLQRALGPGLQVDSPSARGQQFEAMAQIYSMTANVTSLFALLIGLFLIYNTFSIAVTQRRAEIGILRALGATRGQVRGLFLMESGIAGVTGSLAGVGVGMLIARGLSAYLSGLFGEVYGVAQRADQVAADPRLLLGALAAGTLSSVLAGWIPARAASGVDPVKALQKGRVQVLSEGENRIRRWLAIACAVSGIVCVWFGHRPAFFYSGYLLSVCAALLITPWASSLLVRLLRPWLKAVRPVEGALAADSLLQAPRRTSSTVAALTLSLALVIALAGVARASYESIRGWLDTTLNPDLFVTSSETFTERSFRFPASLGAGLAAIESVEEVQPVRSARILYKGTPVMLVAAPIRQVARRIRIRTVEGDTAASVELTAAGKALTVSDNFALLRKVRLGEILEIPTPSGVLRLPVSAINIDYSDQQGSILIDLDLYQRLWQDTTINIFRIYVKPGADSGAVRGRILDQLGGHHRLFVFTNRQLRDFILRITDQWFGITYVQIFVAVLVAILGIVNSLTVSIADRRRELGVLQAVGGLRRQVRHTIWMEALTMGVLGLILGYALGAVNLYYILEVTRRDLAGLRFEYQYPIEIAAILLPVILGAALLAALGPARGATRGVLVEALEYE
jgi:putative ABC transport system permease protein